jgi:hypothetical protein
MLCSVHYRDLPFFNVPGVKDTINEIKRRGIHRKTISLVKEIIENKISVVSTSDSEVIKLLTEVCVSMAIDGIKYSSTNFSGFNPSDEVRLMSIDRDNIDEAKTIIRRSLSTGAHFAAFCHKSFSKQIASEISDEFKEFGVNLLEI